MVLHLTSHTDEVIGGTLPYWRIFIQEVTIYGLAWILFQIGEGVEPLQACTTGPMGRIVRFAGFPESKAILFCHGKLISLDAEFGQIQMGMDIGVVPGNSTLENVQSLMGIRTRKPRQVLQTSSPYHKGASGPNKR